MHLPRLFVLSAYAVFKAVMLMETFGRLSRKEKYVWDVRIAKRLLGIFSDNYLDVWSCKVLILNMTGLSLTYLKSGDGPDIMLTEEGKPLTELKDRWKVTEKMFMIPQYAFAGDFTGMCSLVQSSFWMF